MVLRDQKAGSGSAGEVNVVGSTPLRTGFRKGYAGGRVSRCPTTKEAGPELPGFPFEISSQLVWFESFLCIKVGVQVRSSWSESQSPLTGGANNGS